MSQLNFYGHGLNTSGHSSDGYIGVIGLPSQSRKMKKKKNITKVKKSPSTLDKLQATEHQEAYDEAFGRQVSRINEARLHPVGHLEIPS